MGKQREATFYLSASVLDAQVDCPDNSQAQEEEGDVEAWNGDALVKSSVKDVAFVADLDN